MSLCPKCSKEVEAAGNLCAGCMAAVVEEAANPPAASAAPRWTNVRQRALAGAKRGALHGALYGGLYGAIGAMLIYAFAEGDRALTAVYLIVSWAIAGSLILTPFGALLYILFPDKPKTKPAPAADAAVEKDTKIDHS
jgi:hypothetical protein